MYTKIDSQILDVYRFVLEHTLNTTYIFSFKDVLTKYINL